MRYSIGPVVLALPLVIAACAQSPPPAEAGSTAPPPAHDGRIYFYRAEGPYQAQSWTTVYLNDRAVGEAAPSSAFYRDVPPGQYNITVRSRGLYPGQFKSVTLDPGQTLYVRIETRRNVSTGRRSEPSPTIFYVQPVEAATGRQEVENLVLSSS